MTSRCSCGGLQPRQICSHCQWQSGVRNCLKSKTIWQPFGKIWQIVSRRLLDYIIATRDFDSYLIVCCGMLWASIIGLEVSIHQAALFCKKALLRARLCDGSAWIVPARKIKAWSQPRWRHVASDASQSILPPSAKLPNQLKARNRSWQSVGTCWNMLKHVETCWNASTSTLCWGPGEHQ